MAANLDTIENGVQEAIRHVDARWKEIGKSDAVWTRELKNAIGAVGKRMGFTVCAAGSKYRANGEWLYDMTWLDIRGGVVLDVPLALESEWTPDRDLMFDFQKLLVSRARHRVMLFWQGSASAASRQIDQFLRQVARYRGTRRGDRYLFAYYIGGVRPIEFRLHVAK